MPLSKSLVNKLGDATARCGRKGEGGTTQGTVEDVPIMVEVARPHVERAVSDASVYMKQRGKEVRTPVDGDAWWGFIELIHK